MKNKKSLIALLLIAVIGLVGSTFSYFTNYISVKNDFVAGTYSVAVVEQFISPEAWTPGTVTPKVVNITNEGNVAIALRAKFIEEWTAADGETTLDGIRHKERVAQYSIHEDWELAEDGYYYYIWPVEAGDTSPNIIESVTYNPNFYLEEGLDIECNETNNDGYISQSCKNLESGYAGAEYKLTIIIESIQLDQKWAYKLPQGYTVKYHANGGEGTMSSQRIKYNEVEALTKNSFVNEGYHFLGWSTTETGDKVYNDMESVVNLRLEGTVDLYAIWVADSYTVNFDYNGGTGTVESTQVVYGKKYGALPEYPYKKDMIFAGWYTEKEGGTKIYPDSIVDIKKDHTLYAQWLSSPYNTAIQDIVIQNVPDENNDGVIDAIYLRFQCSSSFEKYNIPIKNLVVGQKYKLSFTASNNAEFGQIEAGYKASIYGSMVTSESVLSSGSIKDKVISASGLIAEWDDRAKGDEWLHGPFEKEIIFTAEASTMYWTWDFGLMKDGVMYDFNFTDIVLEPIVPEINFANKKLVVHASSEAQVLNDISNDYDSNFTFYGNAYAETLYYSITNLSPGLTYSITFEHKYTGKLIDDSANTSNLRYEYGTGIMSEVPTAYGSYMTNIGTYISNTFVMKSVTGNVETVTLTFKATSDKVYWVWNMANCSDNYNNDISIKITDFSATDKNGKKITYYSD